MCLSFYIHICSIWQRNKSAFSLMRGSNYACQKRIWNSQQKHIKAIRKIKTINTGEKLFEAYFESARLPDCTHWHYPHAKRELFSLRADRNKKRKVMVKPVLSDLHPSHIPQELLCPPAKCLVSRGWGVVGCSSTLPEGGVSWWMLQVYSQRLKVQERLWDSKCIARLTCFEEKWCDYVLGL